MPEMTDDDRVRDLEAELKALRAEHSGEFDGLARCSTVGCEQFGDRPLRLRRDSSRYYDHDGRILNSAAYSVPADAAEDLLCPGCGNPSAVLDEPPRKYAKMIG